jgi:DNA topoisomerase-3
MTAFNSKSGGFQLTTVGRVQTPTLAILVEREERIRGFRPRDYWEVHGTFGAAAGEYAGRWFDERWTKNEEDPDARAERLWEEAKAVAVVAKCRGKPGIVTEESKPTTQGAPLLYDLTSLQREANGRFGLSARTTLSLAQALYEKHKVLTYPRTDSRALPEDYLATVKSTMEVLKESNAYGGFAREVLKQKWVRPNKRIFDNTKVSDHFAIIPTLVAPKHLNELEAKLYDFVVKRFLAAFYPPAEFLVTTRITRVESEPFKSEGKVLVVPGWLAVYGKEAQADDAVGEARRQDARRGQVGRNRQDREGRGRAEHDPAAGAPQRSHAAVGDGRGREAHRRRRSSRSDAREGLGTPATRAQIIEGLISERYVLREGRELIPTAKAFSL